MMENNKLEIINRKLAELTLKKSKIEVESVNILCILIVRSHLIVNLKYLYREKKIKHDHFQF